MIHLVEKSSKLVSASVKSFSFIGEIKMKKKYFNLNKWRLAQVAADYSTKRENNIEASNPICNK